MAHVPVRPFFDRAGNRVVLGRKIGSGGEGDVYEILNGSREVVAKIYHKPLSEQKQAKLLLMVRGCNEELKAISAWPTGVLARKPGGPVAGFLMPRIADYEPIHTAYGPTHRKEVFPHADWRFLVRTAKNLAAAFYVIHKFGYVIGDVNEGNILVNDKACVRLIDCDSFQVRAGDRLYPCEVGVAHFTPPEIQAEKHYGMERTANHDNFGLAILIFQLLFLGRHPYAGVYAGPEDMPIEKAIAEFRFAYGKQAAAKRIAPPPNTVGLTVVPGQVAGLFEAAFAEAGTRPDGRPVAGDWWEALGDLEDRMRRCSSDSVHWHYAGLSGCPWCRLEESSGLLIFLSADTITKIDLRHEWQKVEAIPLPGPLPRLGPGQFSPAPVALPPHLRRSLSFRELRLVAAVTLAAVTLVLVISEILTDYLLPAGLLLLVAILVFFPDAVSAEKARRQTALRSARYLWDLWNKKWVAEAGDGSFHAELGHLRDQKRKFEEIERAYRKDTSALELTIRDRQLVQFLQRSGLGACPLSRLDRQKREALDAAGIRSAADITPQALRRIPQLDNTLVNELLAWRERCAKTFLFDPSRGVEREEVQALIHKYQPMIKPVERELKTGTVRLRRIQEEIQKKRVLLRPAVEKRARELAQAEADYEVFRTTLEEMVAKDIRSLLGIGDRT